MEAGKPAALTRRETETRKRIDQYLKQNRTRAVSWALRYFTVRDDADDAVQEAAMRAVRSSHRYDPKLSFETWFRAIVCCACVDILRARSAQKRPREVHLDSADGRVTDRFHLEDAVLETLEGSRAHILAAIATMPDEQGKLLIDVLVFELDIEEIRKEACCSTETIRKRYRAALKVLQDALIEVEEYG